MALAGAAGGWCDLLRQHIGKEDGVLFPMAKQMLDHAAIQRLRKGFASFEEELMGTDTHCRYEELGRKLTNGGDVVKP
jgi:hemerythrin-like domain-containing protein